MGQAAISLMSTGQDHPRRPDGNLIADIERFPVRLSAVEEGPIRAPQILEDKIPARNDDRGVTARYVWVIDHEGVSGSTPDGRSPALDDKAFFIAIRAINIELGKNFWLRLSPFVQQRDDGPKEEQAKSSPDDERDKNPLRIRVAGAMAPAIPAGPGPMVLRRPFCRHPGLRTFARNPPGLFREVDSLGSLLPGRAPGRTWPPQALLQCLKTGDPRADRQLSQGGSPLGKIEGLWDRAFYRAECAYPPYRNPGRFDRHPGNVH